MSTKEMKPEKRRSFSLRLRRASSTKSVHKNEEESAAQVKNATFTKPEPRKSLSLRLLRANSAKAVHKTEEEPAVELKNKPEPRRSFSLRMRRASSSKSVNKSGEEPIVLKEKNPKKKTFPRIGGLVRRMSSRRKSKSNNTSRTTQQPGIDANTSFETEDTIDPSEKSLHQVDLSFMDSIEKEEEQEEKDVEEIIAPQKALEVIVLVIDPTTRHFELVLLEFFLEDFHVSDLLARIPLSVIQEELRKMEFEGVCDLHKTVFSDDTLMTDVCPSGRDILVAMPRGVSVEVCSKQARIVLSDREVLQLLKSTGIDCSAWITGIPLSDDFNGNVKQGVKKSSVSRDAVKAKNATPNNDEAASIETGKMNGLRSDEENPNTELSVTMPAAVKSLTKQVESHDVDMEIPDPCSQAVTITDDIEVAPSPKTVTTITGDIEVAVKETQRTVSIYLLLILPLLVLTLSPQFIKSLLVSIQEKY